MIELWREAMRSLPSETFLDLVRTYLGPVRTPYRKHELMEELESFLKKKETAQRIVSLLDEADSACLSAIMILGSGERSLVAEFMGSDRAQALSRIVNLEERLLIYESPAEDGLKRSLMINPLLAQEIRRYAFEPALVFPPAVAEREPARAEAAPPSAFPSLDRLDPTAVAALLCFFLADDRTPRRKLDGELKIPVKAEREFESSFPAGWNCSDAAGFLEASRVCRFVDGKFALQRSEAEAFFSSAETARSRAAAIAAGIPEAAVLVRASVRIIPPGIAFSREAVLRFILAAAGNGANQIRPGRDFASRLASGMARAGLLSKAPESADGFILGAAADAESAVPIQVGADYHVMVGEGTRPPDLLFLAQCLDLTRLGAALELNLNRRSAARAYRLGSGREATENRLTRLAGGPLPQNLAYSLDAWEREHRSVNIASGILVYGDERLSRFMEHSPSMKERVVERISAGVYLTDFDSADDCEKALQRAGMETPPRLLAAGPRVPVFGDQAQRAPFSAEPVIASEGSPFAAIEWGKRRERPPLDPEAIMSELVDRVKSSEYPKEAKEALAERIRLKLIIGTAGLRPDSVRYEKSEAGGLDYLGKVKLIERALGRQDWLLDILYRDSGGEPTRRTVRPLSLHKSPNGLLLECSDEEVEGGRSVKIPVDKISNVKRIRLSLFG
jgi:hypothetical protein